MASSSTTQAPGRDSLREEVEALLERRTQIQDPPKADELVPAYNFLIPTPHAGASSSTVLLSVPAEHWYCAKAPSELHRRAATYLIFLFAFKRSQDGGTAKVWIETLELILRSCPACARGFGCARRLFGRLYLSKYAAATIKTFYKAVDVWQCDVTLAALGFLATNAYGSTSSETLFDLPQSYLLLLFNEPSVLADPRLEEPLGKAIAASSEGPSAVSGLGLSAGLISMLASPEDARRQWALKELRCVNRQCTSLEEWCDSGLGTEVQNLLYGSFPGGNTEQWTAVKTMLNLDVLSPEVLRKGILAGQYDGSPPRPDRSVMALIARLLGSPSTAFPIILECLATVLRISPTRFIWQFDQSAELPHTLFSDIKKNASFQELLASARPTSDKGKEREETNLVCHPLVWISDYLLSVYDAGLEGSDGSNGFSETLAKIISFCFSDMQHDRLEPAARSAAAEAGCEALIVLQGKVTSNMATSALKSAIEVHAQFIGSTAFQPHPDVVWDRAREEARKLLSAVFDKDGKDILESVLGLAVIAQTERRRLKLKHRAVKLAQKFPDSTPVKSLHRAAVRRELWAAAYQSLSPSDVSGLALMIKSVAPFSHLEALDRREAWNPTDLKEVVDANDWIISVRAINSGLNAAYAQFATTLEALAAQPDPKLLQSLWQQPDVAKAAIILLMSPADNIHESIINLIQHSFEDVDDRGDCIRVLLEKFPIPAMDGLSAFLASFIQTASKVPEACSLAKWLVRCFTDVLDALCQSSGSSPPLLQSNAFLSSFAGGKWMTHRIGVLWQQMTDSLALIFKRTADWAPYYANEVMVDWMRDALVFGRAVTEHIRIFENAMLNRTRSAGEDPSGSPIKLSNIGKNLVQKLEVVLRDLVGWLRLTDAETLHQTYELIKTILGRISKSNPDLSTEPQLEATLLELDKFCRRASSRYTCRLSDDLLSELSDLLSSFDLPLDDDVQFVSATKPPSTAPAENDTETLTRKLQRASVAEGMSRSSSNDSVKEVPKASSSSQKNAFAMMMKKAGGSYSPSDRPSKPKPTKPRQMTLDEFDDDDFMDGLSANDLDLLESRARSDAGKSSNRPSTVRPSRPSEKLVLNVVPKSFYPPKPAPKAGSFTSKFMRDLSRDHKQQQAERKRAGVLPPVPRLPNAGKLGSGLGAYTGPPKPAAKPVDSGSSASDSSSDEENKGIGALVQRQKPAVKPAERFTIAPKRSIKILGSTHADIMRERDERRRKNHAKRNRLHPDTTPLYRYVLAWDPQHNGSRPPYPGKMAMELGPLKPVPTTFVNAQQYERTLFPLFLQELWAQFIKDTPSQAVVRVEVASRAYEDDFIDMDVNVKGNLPPNFFINETDVVTIQMDAPDSKPLFAKVQGFRRKMKESAIKLRILTAFDQRGLGASAKLILKKHTSLSTAIREYAALRGLQYYEDRLLADVLAARSSAMPTLPEYAIKDAIKNYRVNEPQAKAILGAMGVEGFALIQGPPGTGKTKTISGLVGKFLSERKAFIPPVNGEAPRKAKLLVCAPSNAAIDEVCKRLMDGVPSSTGSTLTPNIVRIGVETSVNVAVKDVSLDNIVEARVNQETAGKNSGGTDLARIQAELEEVKEKIREKQAELQRAQGNDEKRRTLETEFHQLNTRRTKLGQQSTKAKDAARDATRHLDGARRAAREAVLREADVICATLSGAGHEVLAQYEFETVIIDEAAQAIEMSCLIPLKYGCKRCIMVGDPNQLPPTTFSSEAEANKFNQSLFVRIAQQRNSHMHLLSIQYRMNPAISELPSKVFYDGRLKDGPDMAAKTKAIWYENDMFGPYHFVNVEGQETKAGTSTRNTDEARVAVDIYRNLERQFGRRVNLSMRIGIITMYKEQLYELKRNFNQTFGADILETIDFNTVDGFQGQEKDIIILSCVRSGPNLRSIGFLRDYRRMNVALTRAKSSLFVIGNASTLERSDEKWKTVVTDARDRHLLVNYTPTTFSESAKSSNSTYNPKRPRSISPPSSQGTQIPVVGSVPKPLFKRKVSAVEDAQPVKRPKPVAAPAPPARAPQPPPPRVMPPPPPPTSEPPRIPPPPVAGPSNPPPRIPPPRAPPPRSTEEVLFMKKKKKPNRPAAPPPVSNVRAAMNTHLIGGRRGPPPPGR